MQRISARWLALLCTIVLLGTGCSSTDDTSEGTTTEGTSEASSLSGSATAFAAASLTESFSELKAKFEQDNPNATINLNFGASSALAAQITEQGGADLFASADTANMDKVKDLVDEPVTFAKNRLEIIVPKGNPKGVEGLASLAKPGLKVILAAPQVPVGRYAREALDKAGVTVKPVSEAADVKGVVGPVTLGEADAGIAYATDVTAAGDDADGVEIPDDQNVIAEYPIALVKGTSNAEVARAFLDLILSDKGEAVLTDHGFLAP